MEGYTKLANVLATFPELASFRKFSQLNMELLGYQQAEISELESDIEVLRNLEDVDTARSWAALKSADPASFAAQKRQKLIELDEKMRTYRHDLLEVARLEAMAAPSKLSIRSIRRWLASDDGGKKFLSGSEGRPWWSDHERDLVTLASQYDTLDRACMRGFSPFFHAVAKKWKQPAGDEEKGLNKVCWYEPKYFTFVADMLCVFASALVPSASILGLLYANTMKQRLVMILTLTLAFAGIVLIGFGCRRSETFAATVAFAAVQVVFVESVSNYKP